MAVALTLLALGAAMALNGHQLKLVKSARESNASSLLLQDRIERFRTISWSDFTNASYLRDTFLPTRPKSADYLPNIGERITLTAFGYTPDGSPHPEPPQTPYAKYKSILVEYAPGAAPVALLTGINSGDSSGTLSKQSQAKVEMTVTWTGKDNRQRTRSYASVISIAGVNTLSLPGFGGPGFEPFGTPSPGATPTPSPTGTPTPEPSGTPTPSPATPTPEPGATPTPSPTGTPTPSPATPTPSPATPTPAPGNGTGNGNVNGNGNGGLGNAGGQGGKK